MNEDAFKKGLWERIKAEAEAAPTDPASIVAGINRAIEQIRTPPDSVFEIHLEAVTEPRAGVWCEQCALPSAFEFEMAAIHGGKLLHIGTYKRCPECPEDNILVQCRPAD